MSWFDEPGLPAEVVALRSGDEDLFVELVRGLSPVLLRLARSCTSNDAAAQDAVQDTWVVVVDSLDAFAGRSSLKSWVCGICLHTARRRGVRESRTSPFSSLRQGRGPAVDADRFAGRRDATPTGTWLVPPVRWDTQPEEHLAEAELRAAVKEAIGRLPVRQREVITARDVVGLDAAETAEALALSAGNERVLLHRARSRVRAELEEYAGRAGRSRGGSAGRAAPPPDLVPRQPAAAEATAAVPVTTRPGPTHAPTRPDTRTAP